MSHIYNNLFGAIIFVFAITLSACGGGGSGGTSGQAVLNPDTAQAFASNLAGSGPPEQVASGAPEPVGTGSTPSITGSRPKSLMLSGQSCNDVGEIVTTVDYDVKTGIFNGSVEFINFRPIEIQDCLLYMNGMLQFSGTTTKQTGTYQDFEMTYGIVSQLMNGEQITIFSEGTTNFTNTQDMDVHDKTRNVDYHYNLTTSVTGSTGPGVNEIIEITGKLTSLKHGYVNVTTTIPIESSEEEFIYSKGQVQLDGANGSKALLTYVPGGFTLEIDSDGDGIFETSRTCDWLVGCN